MQMTEALVGGSKGIYPPPWSRNTSSLWTFNESRRFACFL